MSLPVRLSTLRALIKEINVSAQAGKPLVVGGARELAPLLRRELGVAGPAADAAGPEGAAVYVHILGGDDDEAQLKRARRARVPIVALAPAEVESVPYVLATDIVRVQPGAGFPLAALADVIAARLGEEGAPLAAQVPALRRAVGEQLVESFARKNGLVAAAVFIPRAGSVRGEAADARRRRSWGVDLPVLARNELRLVLRLEQAYGRDPDPRGRLPEIAGTLAVSFGLRAVARELLDLVPGDADGGPDFPAGRRRLGRRRFQQIAGWAVKSAVAYAGTRALGEAALRRLEAVNRRPGRH